MKSEGTSKKRVYIILAVMICVQLASIIYYFQFKKEGYHSDEMWSYGYANSYYLQHIFQDEQGKLIYVNDWYDADVLRDYIVVNEGEEFTYDSIYHNQITDLSPPFHSMVLHTICSFFPGEFSRWFSFCINIVSFIVAMIFLFKSARILKNDIYALCCCAAYGFSVGARDTFIYLRMYAMCTAFLMVIIYNILQLWQKYKESRKLCKSNLVMIFLISLLSFLTHYYMVSFVGILTFVICAFSFLKKEYKFMLVFGLCMLLAFILSVVIFPAMFSTTESQVGAEAAVMDYNLRMRFIIVSHYILKSLFNISLSVYPSGNLPILLGILCFVGIVFIPLFVLLRDVPWMKKFRKYVKITIFHPVRLFKYLLRRINWIYIILLIAVIGQIIVVGEASSVYSMGRTINRYSFFMFPIIVILFVKLVYQLAIIILRKTKRAQCIMLGICVFLVGMNIYNCTQYTEYLFLRNNEADVKEYLKDQNCIFLRYSNWMTTAMVPILMEADEFAQLEFTEYENIQELYEKKKDEKVVVILDSSFRITVEGLLKKEEGVHVDVVGGSKDEQANDFYNGIIDYLENLEPETKMEHVTTQTVFGRSMEVYLVNP